MNLKWTSKNIAVADIINAIDNKRYILDPEHQRGVVHNDTWKMNIIDSIFNIGVLPATMWHMRNGKMESLDGKQRINAIYEYCNNKFKWEKKYYKDLPEEQRMFIDNHDLIIIYCTTTLTDDQIANFFSKIQQNKRTTVGEMLNSNLVSPITKKIELILADKSDFFNKYFGVEEDRHSREDLLFQVLHIYKYSNSTLGANDIASFLNDEKRKTDYCDDDLDDAMALLYHIIHIFEDSVKYDRSIEKVKQFKNRCKKSTILPFVIFLRDDVKSNDMEIINSKNEYLITNMKSIFNSLWSGSYFKSDSKTPKSIAKRIEENYHKVSRT